MRTGTGSDSLELFLRRPRSRSINDGTVCTSTFAIFDTSSFLKNFSALDIATFTLGFATTTAASDINYRIATKTEKLEFRIGPTINPMAGALSSQVGTEQRVEDERLADVVDAQSRSINDHPTTTALVCLRQLD